MHMYLVQHGEAKPEAEDPARPLTDRGRKEVGLIARHAAVRGIRVAEIRHSGKLRARQTADVLAAALSPSQETREMDGLAPTDCPVKAKGEVESAREPLMIVGHLPHLSRLASLLLVGDPSRELIQFRNGGIVCLVKAESGWLLEWALTPELAGI